MSFTWVPFYREVAERVLEYEDRQDELVQVLRAIEADGADTMFLTENQADGEMTELKEIDPFTFLANFSCTGDEKAERACHALEKHWDLQEPSPGVFYGRVKVSAIRPWFFSSVGDGRAPDDIAKLWDLAKQVLQGRELDAALFARCLKIRGVGASKLTTGLFWLDPARYLATTNPIISYLERQGVRCNRKLLEKGDFAEYQSWLQAARAHNDYFPDLSHGAWTDRNHKVVKGDFTWVPFYREVAAGVLEYEDCQDELLALLREMKAAKLPTVPLEHDKPTLTPLTTIDPFTFMANFGRNLETSNYAICQWMREKWQLKTLTPTDFSGRHGVQANYRGSWFFGSMAERIPNDTDYLWQLAKQAYDGEVDSLDVALVAQCLSWPNLQMKKLSMGLSWLNPEAFLPLSGAVLRYAEACGMSFRQSALLNGDLDEYRAFMDAAHQVDPSHVAFVKAAYQTQTDDDEVEEGEVAAMPDFPLNQILYGPPGTGKTYGTIERAVEIIDGVAARSHVEAKVRFDELRANGQIEFVTFHQSFSYEEFIEGLRPILDEDGEGQARYEVRGGVLKTLALRATDAAYESIISIRPTFDQIWEIFLERLKENDVVEGLGKGRYKIEVSTTHVIGDNITGKAAGEYKVSIKNLCQIWERLPFNTRPDSPTLRGILGKGFACNLAGAIFQAFQEIEANGFPELANPLDFSNAPRYVLIVDEINRGNISKILGELITLLEPDKRIGADNELRVQLPVSGEQFALPPNLYLLGTMNTADKSLALLDVALRRRFDFIEMAPDNSLFPEFARDVLTQLNLRLEAALDREHRIGHAVFINCESESDFNEVFRKKIIPLLQEFFYNDWETLRAVLGESGDNGVFIKKLVAPSGMKARTKWRWWFDEEDAGEFDILEILRKNYHSA